jgi:predicted SnoaL-like aldol condensation-catalyzing enzyme
MDAGSIRTLFNKRDYDAASRFWSDKYTQPSAYVEPGRADLFNLIKASPASLKYEPGLILAGGDLVIVHRRFSDIGLPRNWIAADIVRIAEASMKRVLAARTAPESCKIPPSEKQRARGMPGARRTLPAMRSIVRCAASQSRNQ